MNDKEIEKDTNAFSYRKLTLKIQFEHFLMSIHKKQ